MNEKKGAAKRDKRKIGKRGARSRRILRGRARRTRRSSLIYSICFYGEINVIIKK